MKITFMAGIVVLAVLMMVGVAAAASIGEGSVSWDFTGSASNPAGGIGDSYWAATVTESDAVAVPTGSYVAWCVQHVDMAEGSYDATFYDSRYDAPDRIAGYDWNAINWILNNKEGRSEEAVQAAIWHFDGGYTSDYAAWFTGADYEYLTENADSDFVPGPGQVYAVIVDSGCNLQINIIEVPVPIPSPEFPTLAVPVGLLVGMVGAVAVIRGRQIEA